LVKAALIGLAFGIDLVTFWLTGHASPAVATFTHAPRHGGQGSPIFVFYHILLSPEKVIKTKIFSLPPNVLRPPNLKTWLQTKFHRILFQQLKSAC